jgi:Domain of unknown function (DUF4365)
MGAAADRIERIGVHGVATLIIDALGWKFREQHESDWDIDAIVEVAVDDVPTGRLIALQIKSGQSYFDEVSPSADWVLRGPKRHLSYWLEHQLPVLVVLFDPRTQSAYWVQVTQQTATWDAAGFQDRRSCNPDPRSLVRPPPSGDYRSLGSAAWRRLVTRPQPHPTVPCRGGAGAADRGALGQVHRWATNQTAGHRVGPHAQAAAGRGCACGRVVNRRRQRRTRASGVERPSRHVVRAARHHGVRLREPGG